MLKRNLMSFAIIVSGLFLANQANGQLSATTTGISSTRTVQTQSIKSPRDVASGQLIDTSTGEIVWARSTTKKAKGKSGSAVNATRPSNSLIDTSTGEIVWADEIRSTRRRGFTGSDEELGALIAW